jgi:hypothetical protein
MTSVVPKSERCRINRDIVSVGFDRCPPHSWPMSGSPRKRQRKLGVRDEDGSVIAFPYMPRVADLPRGVAALVAGREDHLLRMSLDDIAEIQIPIPQRLRVDSRSGFHCAVPGADSPSVNDTPSTLAGSNRPRTSTYF